MTQSVRFMPVSLFGAAMGLCGFALATRAAAPLLGFPDALAGAWSVVGLTAYAALACAYFWKVARHRDAVLAEWASPAQMGFFGSIWIATALAGACLAPYAYALGKALWWLGAIGITVTQIAALARWLAGGIDLAQINAGWMIAVLGPIPVAGPGIYFEALDAARFIFGAAAVLSPFIVGFVLLRMFTSAPLAPAARPTAFILLVPFALIYAYGPALWDTPVGPVFDTLFEAGVMLTVALLVFARGAAGWPFGPAWWAFTFPLDAMAIAGVAYSRSHTGGAAGAVAWVLWLLALAAVLLVLARTLLALARGSLLAAPKAA